MARISYVYGIVVAEPAASGAPLGLDDAPVVLRREGDLAAITSELDSDQYDTASIEERSGDVDWVAARAVAHDRVLSWASDRGPVVPLAMFTSMFRSADGVRDMLRERASSLHAVLRRVGRGREYALRVYRIDAELRAALPSLNPEIASLSESAKAAAPGQRYLLERKLDERLKEELRATSSRIAIEIHDELAAFAVETAMSPIPRVATGSLPRGAETTTGAEQGDVLGTMVLNAAFLVAPGRMGAFQERLTEIVAKRQAAGFRFDFTGPWPPYHFAHDGDHE